MCRYAAIASALLAVALLVSPAHGDEITTYGAGLLSCKAYLEARQEDGAKQVAFVDWLSGYFSGVNKTSTHRNNFFGLSDLNRATSWLEEYCSARPLVHFAEAVGMMLLGAKPGPPAHSIGATTYGSADKSCSVYLESREQRDASYADAAAEFTNWLGGYMSGVNAMSFSTNNVLGSAELTDAVSWLVGYCSAHPLASFGNAVDALVLTQQPRYASQPNAPAKY